MISPLCKPVLVAASLAMLGACNAQPEVSEENATTAQTDAEPGVAPEMLPVTDFAELALGARIVGPQGPEVKARLTNASGAFADITSYVACPEGFLECDPATVPDDTLFTFVHIVYPGEDNDPDTGSGAGNDASDVETAEAFRMTQPSHGFTGVAGYSFAEAQAALGSAGRVFVSCHEDGIAWTLAAGDGGDQWEQAEPITFFWQSTLPPAGPAQAYEIFANFTSATGPGPYPDANAARINACASPDPSTAP